MPVEFVQAYVHTHCGGIISSRKCTKCGKKWNIISFLLTPTEIRPQAMSKEEYLKKTSKTLKKTSYMKWADKLPGVSWVPQHLPNWPRWARILSSIIVFSGIGYGLYRLITWMF